MDYFVFVNYTVSAVFSNAGEGLSDDEFEAALDLVAHEQTNRGELIVAMDDADLVLAVLEHDHAGKDSHSYVLIV